MSYINAVADIAVKYITYEFKPTRVIVDTEDLYECEYGYENKYGGKTATVKVVHEHEGRNGRIIITIIHSDGIIKYDSDFYHDVAPVHASVPYVKTMFNLNGDIVCSQAVRLHNRDGHPFNWTW